MDPTASRAIDEMERFGIDQSVILVVDWGYKYGPGEDSVTPVEEFNRITLENCKRHPGKLYAMAGFDPRRPAATRLFEQAVTEWGAVGLKVYPPTGFQPNEEMMFPLYQKALDLDVPVLIHTGWAPNTRWAWPEWVEEVAIKFPKLRILMGHTNVQTPYESGSHWRGLNCAWRKPNVYLDLCGFPVNGAITDRNLPDFLHFLRIALDKVGPRNICWGTDLPGAGMGWRQQELLTWVDIAKNLPAWGEKFGERFTEDERDGICFKASEHVLSNVFGKE
jgi:predicted TIM-barrel fold metal-dependent hydrolase